MILNKYNKKSDGEVIQDQDERRWSISECSSISFRSTDCMVSKALGKSKNMNLTELPCFTMWEREFRVDGRWWHHPPQANWGPLMGSTRTSLSRAFIRSYVSASSQQPVAEQLRLLLVLFTRPTNICFIAYTTIILEEVFQSFTRGNSSTKRYNSAYNIVHPSRHPYVEWGFVVL